MFRGNVVMKGYLKNKASTDKAFAGGWFHSGDLGVKHPDGYVQLRDRSKDIIISGGENISSIEVEDALFEHPGVQLAAVVARPDDKWGETPCAFIEMKPGQSGDRRGADRMVPRAARALQVPAPCRVRRDPQDLDRQGAEIRAARAGEADRRRSRPSRCASDAWPRYCRAALVGGRWPRPRGSFPAPGEEAAERVHDVRKTLKEARAIARLFLRCVGEPARVTIAALAVDAPPGRPRARSRRDGAAPAASRAAVRDRRAAERRRSRASARRRGARTGASPRARRAPQLNAIVKRVEAWDLSAVGPEEHRRGGRAHLSAGAAARTPRLRQRRAGGAARVARARGRSALSARRARRPPGRRRSTRRPRN